MYGYPGFDEVSVVIFYMDIQVMIVSSLDLQMNSVLATWSVRDGKSTRILYLSKSKSTCEKNDFGKSKSTRFK